MVAIISLLYGLIKVLDAVTIHYIVRVPEVHNHVFEITLKIGAPSENGQKLTLPAWIPGSYMIRDFAKNITKISAKCREKEVEIKKTDKQTWQCAPCDGLLEIQYSVYAWDLSVRSAHLDASHGFFNGSSTFLKVLGQEDIPCKVSVEQPQEGWQLATGMERETGAHFSFGDFKAKNYVDLIGYPFEMGTFTTGHFEVKGIPHDIVFTGKHYADIERICADLVPICEQHINLFGEAPFAHYTFLVMVTGDGYGGLEHQNSTSLLCARSDLPSVNESDASEGYRNFLGLCSHEYFHAWNVKGIKPQEVVASDLSQETYFNSLWIFEGITSYYDDLALLRCGKISESQYLEILGKTLTRLEKSQGRKLQSLHASSFDAWTKFYKQDENAVNAIVSYYVKGAIIALWLDITLRHEGTGDLDKVMRDFWQHNHGNGITEDDFFASIERVTGQSYAQRLQALLQSTEDINIPWQAMGLEYYTRASCGVKDLGGKAVKESKDMEKFSLGFSYKSHPKGLEIINVVNGSAGETAGLAAQDVVVAVDNLAVSATSLMTLLNCFSVDDTVELHVFRRDELMVCKMKLETVKTETVYLKINEDSDLRKQWWQQ